MKCEWVVDFPQWIQLYYSVSYGWPLCKLCLNGSWKRKWVVVQPNNTRSQVGELATLSVVLELYIEKGAYGKVNSVLVEGATEVKRVLSKSQSLAFEVRKDDKVLVAAAGESETDSQEWMAMFRQQLLNIRKKELTRLPDASEDAYRVSVIPNKYSEGLLLPGDVLAHVTSMTFGLYDLYEGTLIKEWDLRHTKRFSLQSKGPAKDVDRIAVIQFSNRCPHGDGDLLLYSLNAKAFLEKIYENLNTAMDVKSKRTRTASMLFEIPPKELEALGKEIKQEKTANDEGTNGSAQKEETNTTTSAESKDQSDAGTQLSEKEATEEMTAEPDKEGTKDAPKEDVKQEEEKTEDVSVNQPDKVENEPATVDEDKKDDTNSASVDESETSPSGEGEKITENKSEEVKATDEGPAVVDDSSSKEVEETTKDLEDDAKEVEKDTDSTQQTEAEVHAIENAQTEEKSSDKTEEEIEQDAATTTTQDGDVVENDADQGNETAVADAEDKEEKHQTEVDAVGEGEQKPEVDTIENAPLAADEKEGEEKAEVKEEGKEEEKAQDKEDETTESVPPPNEGSNEEEPEQKETPLNEDPAEEQSDVPQESKSIVAADEAEGDTKETSEESPKELPIESPDQEQIESNQTTELAKDDQASEKAETSPAEEQKTEEHGADKDQVEKPSTEVNESADQNQDKNTEVTGETVDEQSDKTEAVEVQEADDQVTEQEQGKNDTETKPSTGADEEPAQPHEDKEET
ncbi:putative dentin sialophosphoprotein isoform X2 [Apostichopus japonicus]|uniref:Putative dentin sialophosphoprotein isoform X2 n=1 Tax=Stichopus japonicus TaxID=307972 RepID=A0A2G8L1W2_STIJA|nr:putative dentin sialophosphoprotein isoform X2 [Apostichopus japonicus]